MNRWSRCHPSELERKVQVDFSCSSRGLTYTCDDVLWRTLRVGDKVNVSGLLRDQVGTVTALYSDYHAPYERVVSKAVTCLRSYRVIITTMKVYGPCPPRGASLKTYNVIAEDHEDALRRCAESLGDYRGKLYAVVDDSARDDARHFTVDVAPPVQTPARIDINPTHSR